MASLPAALFWCADKVAESTGKSINGLCLYQD